MITTNSRKGHPTTRDALTQVELKTPKHAGRVWKGIRHSELIDSLEDEMRLRRWGITKTTLSLSKDKADMVGCYELALPVPPPDGQTFSLGFKTSNAMRHPLKLVVGTTVFVCANGMVSGELVLKKKHTMNFDLAAQLEEGLDRYIERAKGIPILVASLRERHLNDAEADHVLLSAGRAGLLPWTKIGDVDHEYRNPTFSDHGKATSWALLNAFTHIAKATNPMRQMEVCNGFRALLPVAAL